MATFVPELTFGQYQYGTMIEGTISFKFIILNASSFTPASLFTGGFLGGWYDPSDLSSMFQDTAGTVPAVVNSAVARINDKSGGGNHLVQATGTMQPILRQTGAQYYLDFDGVDDRLDTVGAVAPGGSVLTVFAGVTLDVSTTQFFVSNVAGAFGLTGGFRTSFNATLAANAPASGTLYDGITDGSGFEASTVAAPRTRVHTVLYNYAGATMADDIIVRTNGALVANSQAAGPMSTVSFASGVISVGDIAGSGFAFNGRLFGLVLVNKIPSAQEITDTETYLNGKTLAY